LPLSDHHQRQKRKNLALLAVLLALVALFYALAIMKMS
jgi:hypothetical protein